MWQCLMAIILELVPFYSCLEDTGDLVMIIIIFLTIFVLLLNAFAHFSAPL